MGLIKNYAFTVSVIVFRIKPFDGQLENVSLKMEMNIARGKRKNQGSVNSLIP